MMASTKNGFRRVKESDYADSFDLDREVIDGDYTSDEYAALIDQSIVSFKQGEIIRGRVVKKTDDSVIVDIGFKSEGIIPLSEFGVKAQDLTPGDPVDVLLEKSEDAEGMVVLSKEKADRIRVWEVMAEKYEKEEVVEGVIVSKIKGGLTVDIGLKAFLPGSQIDLRPIKNLDKLVGEQHKFKIIKMNKKRGNIVLSRRAILEEQRKATKESTLSQLTEGAKVVGVVKNITEYGAFIDLGGIDGLLHITDMSWGRVNHPSEMFNIGDQVEVIVLKFDKEAERVSLGYKQATPDPWSYAEERYSAGARVLGKIVSIADYGAFVELEKGVEGLVHISEMTWNKHVRHPGKIVNVGDQVDAVVLAMDREKKRISLGMKQIQPNPWENIEEKYPVNSIVEGKVRNVAEFGAFVELEEGVDGLIHISDMSWTLKVKHPSEVLKKRDKVRCMVLNIDKENERLSLGIKQLEKDPWMSVEEKYPVGANVKCKIVKITNFGAFAEIEGGIEGLIHNSQLSPEPESSPRNAVELEQEVTAKIIKVDMANRKIGLSVKAFVEGLSPEQVVSELGSAADEEMESGAEEAGKPDLKEQDADETGKTGGTTAE
ncbi:MAG: 30S ribosomal protein S1 [Nitrospinota bacterium]|nr:30S ribosomal protein S1 [Nitrospinota bacterium]